MANIRKLHKEFQDAIKETEAVMNEFIDIMKSKQPMSLVLFSLQKLWKKFWEFDLLLMVLFRKVIELSIKLEEKTESGTDTAEQIMYVQHFKRFADRMHEDHCDFYEHCVEKMSGIDNLVVGLQLVNMENFCIPKLG